MTQDLQELNLAETENTAEQYQTYPYSLGPGLGLGPGRGLGLGPGLGRGLGPGLGRGRLYAGDRCPYYEYRRGAN